MLYTKSSSDSLYLTSFDNSLWTGLTYGIAKSDFAHKLLLIWFLVNK